MRNKRRMGKCLACGRKVEWEAWAAGPVCYPCYWGARLFYENGIDKVELIPPEFRPQLEAIFLKGGYQWPTDLTWSFINRRFDKCNTELLRWWRPDKETEKREEPEGRLPDGKYKWMKDSICDREGWCVDTSLIQAMQTMHWVMAEIGHIQGKAGDSLVIENHQIAKLSEC